MSETRTNPILRVLPSLADFAFLMTLAFLFRCMEGARALLADGDTGWHLRTGEWILANGRVPRTDLFSFTRPGEPWYAWEWLWDALFAALSRHGGLATVVLVNALLLAVIFALVCRLSYRTSGNGLVSLAVTFIAAAASSVHWLARPHLVTLLMTVVFVSILERRPTARRMAVLAALTVLWTNLHGGFFVGIALTVLYGAGELIAALVSPDAGARTAALRRARVYLAGAAACCAATFVNPYGSALHMHIWQYLRDPHLFRSVSEFLPPDFMSPMAIFFEAGLLAGGAGVFWSFYRRRFAHALAVALWAHLSLVSARNIPIFMIVSAPVIALAVREWLSLLRQAPAANWLARSLDRLKASTAQLDALEAVPRVHVASALGAVVVAALIYAPAPSWRFRAQFDPARFPVNAAAALDNGHTARRMFAPDLWGGYLIYREYPRTRVFVDGRSDFYGAEFSKAWLNVVRARPGWQAELDRYGIDTVLVPPGIPLCGAMKESPRWRVVYDDGTAIVFRTAALSGEAITDLGRDRAITKRKPAAFGAATTASRPKPNSGANT